MGDALIVSPELVLIDADLAAVARALLAPPPLDPIEEKRRCPQLDSSIAKSEAGPRGTYHPSPGARLLGAALALSVALNLGLGLYSWTRHEERWRVADVATPHSATPRSRTTRSTPRAAPAALAHAGRVAASSSRLVIRAREVPASPHPRPAPARAERADTQAAELRLIGEIRTTRPLRRLFVDPATGLPASGVSTSCARLAGRVEAFRCTITGVVRGRRVTRQVNYRRVGSDRVRLIVSG